MRNPYQRLLIKASVTAIRRALKPFLLLLICSLCLWFIYTRYHAFESHNPKIYVTTTPHQPIIKSDFENTTLFKNETHHEIIQEKELKLEEIVQVKIEPRTTNPELNATQNTIPEVQLNISSNQQKTKEPKPNRTIQVVNQNHDDTTVKNDIVNNTKVNAFKICFLNCNSTAISLDFRIQTVQFTMTMACIRIGCLI